ncbi:hypothetical protein RUM44_001195 [Polyplax serrata]|uniref:Spondin domain-containing protein n=1 Tax=Polyplax serrata TaxID=468196 RepID=A0ABR1BAK1_POLSC
MIENSNGKTFVSMRWMMNFLKCGFVFVTITSVLTLGQVTGVTQGKLAEYCQPDKLTVYKVILHTFWTRDKFPKHYPDWRPPAQWSKLVGTSGDGTVVYDRFVLSPSEKTKSGRSQPCRGHNTKKKKKKTGETIVSMKIL